ncbi:hypothetical protein H072_5964 [Dactylellina haptotyla CBS 200.50]|uniref:Uncharacterized protein n=1 Tax=Dactylellina haptotyla (strain CBS 200.50) TaxID=1284197 RepID=S8BLE6_DACHA|nr:hypothetical protein H072_5964 [Dactylellina haptotyla CBS 200.50]
MAAPAASQSVTEGLTKINIPVPPGIDISKHQTPPPGYNKTSTNAGLKKRDYTAQFAYLEIFDNWWYDYNADNVQLWVDPNAGAHLFEENTNLKNRISSIKLYTHAYPGKTCLVVRTVFLLKLLIVDTERRLNRNQAYKGTGDI